MYYKCSVVSFVIYVMWIDSWKWGTSWSWSYGSWIYNYNVHKMYLCNQCLLPLKLWVRIPLRLDTTLSDKACQVTCGRLVIFSGFLHQ